MSAEHHQGATDPLSDVVRLTALAERLRGESFTELRSAAAGAGHGDGPGDAPRAPRYGRALAETDLVVGG